MADDSPVLIVLDTNAVFDLLVFTDPACLGLRRAIETRALQWIATQAMVDECFHVIERGTLAAWRPDAAALRAAWARHCTLVETPHDTTVQCAPRCSDADDQMFIDLAVARRARWLFSKDRAVLRLAVQLRSFGVEVRSPNGWGDAAPAGSTSPAQPRT